VEYGDWGWLRWDYDAVCGGEGGVGVVLGMLVAWVCKWLLYMVGRAKIGQTMTSVNAAVVSEGLAEDEQTLVVDLL
jgi:hypothetical protein